MTMWYDQDLTTVLVQAALLTASLVAVPLGLSLARPAHDASRVWRIARATTWPTALLLAGSTLVEPGSTAALLAFPWLLQTAWLATLVGRGLLVMPRKRLEEVVFAAGFAYLAVGAAWVVLWRAGVTVLGFAGLQALLTANHFHYAGFGACVVVGALGRSIPPRSGPTWWTYVASAVAMISGVSLLAAGIAFCRPLELIAAWVLAAGTVVAGAHLGGAAWRSQHPVSRALLVTATAATFAGAALAAHFSLTGFSSLDGAGYERMVRYHGLVNAVGFVLASLLAFFLAPPRSRVPERIPPFSRIRARGRVGTDFFARTAVLDDGAVAPAGLVDDLDEYASPSFDPALIAADVRSFYERTRDYDLHVEADWQPGFRVGARLWHAFASRVGQLNLPRPGRPDAHRVASRILALHSEKDGRERVRAWVRNWRQDDGQDGAPMYVAAYSSHRCGDRRHMNIAFPLPYCNMTSILRLDLLGRDGGVRLSTLATDDDERDGDQGVYLVTRWGPVRLPLDETIDVWARRDGESVPDGVPSGACTVFATHDMWLWVFGTCACGTSSGGVHAWRVDTAAARAIIRATNAPADP